MRTAFKTDLQIARAEVLRRLAHRWLLSTRHRRHRRSIRRPELRIAPE